MAIAALVILMLILGGCGPGMREIRGELPLVRIEGLMVEGDEVILNIGLRNVNDSSLALRRVRVALMVEGQLLVDAEAQPQINISARGRDVITIRGIAQATGLELLSRRFGRPGEHGAASAAPNASWTLSLTLIDDRERESETRASGFLHPVPGRPGHFR